MTTKVNGTVLAAGLIFLIVLTGIAVWYTFSGPCGTSKIAAAVGSLHKMRDKFYAADEIASMDAGIEQADPLQSLQSIRSETEAIEVPECLLTARQSLVFGMDDSINAYLHLMANDPQADLDEDYQWARESFGMYTDAVQYVLECAPFCPTGE